MTYGHALSLLAIHDRALVPVCGFVSFPTRDFVAWFVHVLNPHAYARSVNHCVSVRLGAGRVSCSLTFHVYASTIRCILQSSRACRSRHARTRVLPRCRPSSQRIGQLPRRRRR
jgi:hypothetical protein